MNGRFLIGFSLLKKNAAHVGKRIVKWRLLLIYYCYDKKKQTCNVNRWTKTCYLSHSWKNCSSWWIKIENLTACCNMISKTNLVPNFYLFISIISTTNWPASYSALKQRTSRTRHEQNILNVRADTNMLQ